MKYIVLWFCNDGEGWRGFNRKREAEAWAKTIVHDYYIIRLINRAKLHTHR